MAKDIMKNYVVLDVDKLDPAEWNYKQEDDTGKINKLKANFKRNGQVENILVREKDNNRYEVINGNHRLVVMHELNLKQAVCYNFGKISDARAKRIAIETNETKFPAENIRLASIMKELTTTFEVDDLLETMPFTKDELENMDNLMQFNFDEHIDDFDEDDDPVGGGNSKEVQCPNCHHRFNP